jgi:hypothetical protein
VQESAESVASANVSLLGRRSDRDRFGDRRLLAECAVWPVGVVVGDVFAQHAFEVAAGEDQDSVEAFAPGAADPAFGMCLRFWCGDRGADHADPFRAKELVEGPGRFDVAVADQDPRPLTFLVQRREKV